MKRMSIYAHPHLRRSGSYFGYAYTFNEISRYLRESTINGEKLQVDMHSPKCKVQLYYGSPPGSFYDHQYKIQMTQWESTLIPPSWVELSEDYDEWWTANHFGAQAFIDAGVPESKIHIYEHGVDSSTWVPSLRGRNKKIRFLHIDSGSPRKRADLCVSAFKSVFGDDSNFELTLKYSHFAQSDADWFDSRTLESRGDWVDTNIRHIKENITLEHLVSLFHFHDVLLYPSEGEGFGLIPLQALATGMPVISTSRWCSYEQYLNSNIIYSTLGKSEVVETYERFGDVVLPDFDSFVAQISRVASDISDQSRIFYEQIPLVVKDYDWGYRTNLAVSKLVDRIGVDMFDSYLRYLK